MPSVSPGNDGPSLFQQILPGAPTAGFQSLTTFTFRWKRYIIYISGRQLNVLRSPKELLQAIIFEEELVAVKAENGDNGRVVVASASNAWILKPVTSAWNRVSWVQELTLQNDSRNNIGTLSWGTEGDLLVGGSQQLCLYNTLPFSRVASPATTTAEAPSVEARAAQWTKPIACPLRFAEFSLNCGLIATAGHTDRLVKVWRRLSFEEAIFDFAYLPHDSVVTHLEWRPAEEEKLEEVTTNDTLVKSYHGADENREILYTISSDGHLRIWRTNSHNDLDMLSLYTTIDLVSAIPHSPVLRTQGKVQRPARYAFTIPAGSYSAAVSAALKKHPQREVKHAIEHLKEVSSKEPDVVVALDTQGRMSAWGLASIGHKRRPESDTQAAKSPFHIAHSESLGLDFDAGLPVSFETWFDGDNLNILAHSFGQSIKWWRGTVENFSSSAALDFDRGEQIACWCGATSAIAGSRTSHDSKLLSWTTSGNIIEWSAARDGYLLATKDVTLPIGIADADSVQRDKSILLLGEKDITLARVNDDKSMVTKPHPLATSDNLSLLRLQSQPQADERYVIYDRTGKYASVLVNPSRSDWSSQEPTIDVSIEAKQIALGADLETQPDLLEITAVMHPRKSGWLRVAGIDAEGVVYRRDVSLAMVEGKETATESTLTFTTGIKAASMVMTSSCAAILSAQRNELVIVDLKEGYVEHQQKLTDSAKHLLFPQSNEEATLTEHSILAVMYSTSVEILARSRYDHVHHDDTPRWTSVKQISIADIGSTISSIAWLAESQLIIAAGNCIFVSDNEVAGSTLSKNHRQQLELTDDSSASIDGLISLMRGPVTCWQPHVLRQLVIHGYFDAVVEILLQLQAKLKFYTNGDELDAALGLDIDLLLHSRSKVADDVDLSELCDQLDELDLPFTSDEDQEKLKLVVRTVSFVARHKASLDVNAVRYLAHWRHHVLLDTRQMQHASTNGQSYGHLDVDNSSYKATPSMSWREINFAYHSTTQQPLLEILIQYYENKLDWPTVRALGITLWLHNIKAAQSEGANMGSVEQVFDAVGQSAYRATQPPNPADASLFLLALRKKAVLLSLWRVAIGNREQKSTQNFLRRDFDVEENKTAARKNAYALMGKRRFQYAAAFFLLADDPISAISILAGQCEDLHLAVSVARAYCGDGSPVLRKFMQDRVLSSARQLADRWLLAWTYAVTAQPGDMMRGLVIDVERLLDDEVKPIRTWQQDDPAALTFYRELRDKKTKQSIAGITGLDEYRAVLRSARVLRRMGFWLLALQLVQHWTFVQRVVDVRKSSKGGEDAQVASTEPNGVPSLLDQFQESKPAATAQAAGTTVPSMLDAFEGSSTKPADDADERAAKAAALLAKMRAKNAPKPAAAEPAQSEDEQKKPTQFHEPASSSILDSFGF